MVAEAVTPPPVGWTYFPFNTAADFRGHLSFQSKKQQQKTNKNGSDKWVLFYIKHIQ